MKIQNRNIYASIFFVLTFVVCEAQIDGTPPPPTPPPPPGLPIDGWIIVLFIAALAYGIFMKLKMSRK